jgi:hypothetical protein
MSDDRTPEQRASDEALDAAIRRSAAAYSPDAPGLVVGWVACIGIMDSNGGVDHSGVAWHMPFGTQPWHITLGILEAARLRVQADFLNPGEDE